MIALMDRFTRGRADITGPRMAGLLSNVIPLATAGGRIETDRQSRGTAGGQA
jgi:hypothetical protein